MTTRTFRTPACLVIACLLVGALAVSAQEPPRRKARPTIPYDGPEIFARLLDHAGLKPVESFERLADGPADQSIIIVFGDPQPLVGFDRRPRPHWNDLGDFVKRGGALLIATDRSFSLDQIPSLGWADVATTNSDLVNYLQNFENQPECPTLLRKEFRRPEHPLFAGVNQPIATNCPGFISMDNDKLQTLALLPLGTMPGPKRDLIASIVESAPLPRRYIVTGPDAGADRVLLIAGHGLFTNCMTVRDDIDNRRLALNTIRWLKGEQRTNVLFVNEGKVVSNFKMPLAGPPKMPMPTIDLVNRIIDAVQNSNILQRVSDRILRPDVVLRVAIVLGTLGLLLYGVKKYFQGRWSLEATPALVGVPPPASTPLVKRQMREMSQRDQLGEPAQALARDWFRTYAKIDFPPGHAPVELSFDVRANMLQRRRLVKHVKSLWKLATEPPPANWNAKKFRGLAIFLEDLSLSAAGGEVIFDSAKPNPRVV